MVSTSHQKQTVLLGLPSSKHQDCSYHLWPPFDYVASSLSQDLKWVCLFKFMEIRKISDQGLIEKLTDVRNTQKKSLIMVSLKTYQTRVPRRFFFSVKCAKSKFCFSVWLNTYAFIGSFNILNTQDVSWKLKWHLLLPVSCYQVSNLKLDKNLRNHTCSRRTARQITQSTA